MFYLVRRLWPAAPKVWTVVLVAEVIVTAGAYSMHTLQWVTLPAVLLSGLLTAATALGGIHGATEIGKASRKPKGPEPPLKG